MARIVYDELACPVVKGRPKRHIPQKLADELAQFPDAVANRATWNADREWILVMLPLSEGDRVCVVYSKKGSSIVIRSVGVVRPGDPEPWDVTEDVLAGDDDTPLNVVYRRAQARVDGGQARGSRLVSRRLTSPWPGEDGVS